MLSNGRSSASKDYSEVEEEDKVTLNDGDDGGPEVDIEEDIYGAMIVSINTDMLDLVTCIDHDNLGISLNLLRFCYHVIILMANYFLQFGLMGWTYVWVIKPAVRHSQDIYRNFHQSCFDTEGNFLMDEWEALAEDTQNELCQIPLANVEFTFVMLLLWVVTILGELHDVERRTRQLWVVPSTQDIEEMIQRNEDGSINIHAFHWFYRSVTFALCIVPKIIIAMILLFVGLRWLSATPCFADLVLNSVALSFILNCDEILYQVLIPRVTQERVQSTKLRQGPKDSHVMENWKGYTRSIVYGILCLLFTYGYMFWARDIVGVGVLPGYKTDLHIHCARHLKKSWTEICTSGEECFPYGHPGP